MDVLKYVVCVLAGYLFGSVNFAIIFCKAIKHEDIRKKGSLNAGATNVARVYGMKMGLLTFIGDFIKTASAMGFGYLLLGRDGMSLSAMACLIGHCWPMFFNFRGGKGVVVGAAIGCILDWRLFIIIVAGFFIAFAFSKRVSVSSLTSALMFPIVLILLGGHLPLEIAAGVLACIIVWVMHIPNIKRIISGTEGKFKPGK